MNTPGTGATGFRLSGDGPARRLTHPLLDPVPGVAHGFTVVGSDLDTAIAAAAGRPLPVFTVRQVHGSGIVSLEPGAVPFRPEPEADALLSSRTGEALAVRVADCVPILIADPRAGLVGAVHAGWRGTVAGILAKALDAFTRAGSRAADRIVVLGPHIRRECFEVGPEVVEAFRSARPPEEVAAAVDRSGVRPHVDLEAANRQQAIAAGVPAAAVGGVGLCTVCRPDLLESYRRSRGSPGRMAGFIARIA